MLQREYDQPVHRRRAVHTSNDAVLDRYPNAQVPSGFEALFNHRHEPIDIVNNFMLSRARAKRRARKKWQNSQRADSDDMAQFLIFLWAADVELAEVGVEDIDRYALNIAEGVSIWTAKHLANNTVRRRLSTLRDFFKYGYESGYFRERLMDLTTFKRSAGFGAKTNEGLLEERAAVYIDQPSQPHPDETIRPLSKAELSLVFNLLGPREYKPGGKSTRDRLSAEAAVVVGLRVSEIADLTVRDVARMSALAKGRDKYANVRFWIRPSKRNRARNVVIPVYLVERLQGYIDGERADLHQYCLKMNLPFRGGDSLFVNTSKSNYRDVGSPTSAPTLSYQFSLAVKRAGLLVEEPRFVLNEEGSQCVDASTGKAHVTYVHVVAHSIHDLRHTFAIQLYMARKQAGDPNPLKAVQSQLGHALSSTTADTYLTWVDIFESELADQLSDFYDEIAGIAAP
jgi:integrase